MPLCAVCSSPASSQCSRCKAVHYCSPAHQKEDWKAHKLQCPRLAQEALATVFHPCEEELLLCITTCLAQNGYHKEVGIMVQVNKAFRWDEQIWDAFKDMPGGGKGGRTRLICAAYAGNLERVRFLLDRGARVNKVCVDRGWTALMGASEQGHLEVVRELAERGANVNAAMTDNGWTALLLSSQKGHLEVVRELCKRGADVNVAETDSGFTVLMVVAIQGYLDIARELCCRGADVNAAANMTTPLHLASMCGYPDLCRLFLELGANKSTLNQLGDTAFDLAVAAGPQENALRALLKP